MNKKIESGIWNLESRIKFSFIIITMAFVAASCNQPTVSSSNTQVVDSRTVATIAGHQINIEIVNTEVAREKGLSNRDSLPENNGMLFEFPQTAQHSFWMKETHFPLDFLWIRDSKVLEITPDVPIQLGVPDRELKIYAPNQPVDWVLEVNAGWAAENNIKVGDSISLTNP